MGKDQKNFDLHGLTYGELADTVATIVSKAEPPFFIITGRSSEMKKRLSRELKKFGYKTRDSIDNPGRVIVEEDKTG